jgi:hypothetical protein
MYISELMRKVCLLQKPHLRCHQRQQKRLVAVPVSQPVISAAICGLTPKRLVVTHQGKGVSNPRMVKEHHAIIYDGDEEPNPDPSELPRPGEPGMRRSIRVKLRSRRDGLHPRSRINFNMSFPIQHNVEVYDMCIVDEAHLDVLRAEYFAVNFPGDDT